MVLVPVTGSHVSSTLQRNTKEYGKKFLFDGCPDTCWNSDQGGSQHVGVRFAQPASVRRIRIQFQGGFAAKACQVKVGGEVQDTIYPVDSNTIQEFPVSVSGEELQLIFSGFTDFYGRLIVYLLEFHDT
ncbi:hypothetical protein ACHWQZ_G008567 [Mnemiopsis leidyi]